MALIVRLLLYLLLALGVARMALYFVDASAMLPLALEAHNLEAKMVLMAYRAEHGLSLYPAWWDYPHVGNVFGPVDFILVGLLGRLLGDINGDGDIRCLFLIGRAVTFVSALLTTLVLGVWIGRRYGRWAGLAGAVLSVGSVPMYGFTVMMRPDAPSELFGVAGFLLSVGRSRGARIAGVALLIVAVLTKQTTGIYLLAAALALALAGARRSALGVLVGGLAGLILVVVAVNVLLEPLLARSLVSEAQMPWDFATWRHLLWRIVVSSPDLLFLPTLGLWFWLRKRPCEIRPAVLTAVLLTASLGLSGKLGADTNYYLSLRVAEAMAVGTLWHAVYEDVGRGRARSAALAAATALAIASIVPSLMYATLLTDLACQEAIAMEGPTGRRILNSYGTAIAQARNPNVHLLTDSGLIDLYQGERAIFGDPWLFPRLVESGRLRPTTIKERIESQYYDVIITTHDLGSPNYVSHDFRLPMVLVELARTHYVLRDTQLGLYFYVPRSGSRSPPGSSSR